MLTDAVVEAVLSNGAVRNIALGIDLQDLPFCHVLEQVAQAENNDLVTHDQHTAPAMVQRNGVEGTSQAQDDVTPALAARGAVVELPDPRSRLGLVGMAGQDAGLRQTIEDAELAQVGNGTVHRL